MLREQLADDLKSAMKSKDSCRVSTLRLILAALKDRDIAARVEGGATSSNKESDDRILKTMLAKMVKQRRESIEMYKQGGRNDLVETETKELSIIEEYLPQAMSEEEVRQLVRETVKETGAESMSDLGKVMPLVMKKGAGKVDGKLAQEVLRELLS